MRFAPFFALAAALVILAALPDPAVAAGLGVSVAGRLPVANYRAASVETADAVYLFGGRDESNVTASVLRYDVRSGATSVAPFSLPRPRMSACAVLAGDRAFVFGGADGGLELDTILAIELGNGSVRTLEAKLASPRIGLCAASFGGAIYIFGGHSNGTKITNITRFDPASGNVSLAGASLPSGRAGMAVMASGRGIYLFGGKTDPGASDEVLLYEPGPDRLTVLPGRMPYTVYHAPAVALGGRILVIGGNAQPAGWNVSRATDTIIEFDPATGESRTLEARLPSPRERSSAASVGERVLVFGGQEGVKALDEIVVLSAASPGGEPGDRTAWTAVAVAAFLAPTAALVYVVGRRN